MIARPIGAVPAMERRDETYHHAEAEPGVALQILTSGTTGPPKRQSINTEVLQRTVFSVTSGEAAPPDAPPELAYWQFGGIGVCQLIAGAYNARRIVVLERFTVDGWVHAVKTHRASRDSGVQPAVIRMLLDADVRQGRPGVPAVHRQRFGSARSRDPRRVRGPVRHSGRVGLWRNRIRGITVRVDAGSCNANSVPPNGTASAGRCPDTQLRIVDPDSGAELPTGNRDCWRPRSTSIGPVGSAPPTSPRSTPTGSSRCTAGPTARSTGAGSRSCRKPFDGC